MPRISRPAPLIEDDFIYGVKKIPSESDKRIMGPSFTTVSYRVSHGLCGLGAGGHGSSARLTTHEAAHRSPFQSQLPPPHDADTTRHPEA